MSAAVSGRTNTRRLVVFIPLVLFLALAALFMYRLGTGDPSRIPSALIGHPAPPTNLPPIPGLDRDGRPVPGLDSAGFNGEVTVLNVWASWCVACREEHPALLAAWARYRERGVILIGIDFEDTDDAALAYAAEMGGDWPLVTDPGSRTAIAYGVFGVPETFVITANGTIAAKIVGAVNYEWLTDEIDGALRQDA